MITPSVAKAQIESLEQAARLWEMNRETAGSQEVADLMRRAARQIQRVLDPRHAEPEPVHTPIRSPEPRLDEAADETRG